MWPRLSRRFRGVNHNGTKDTKRITGDNRGNRENQVEASFSPLPLLPHVPFLFFRAFVVCFSGKGIAREPIGEKGGIPHTLDLTRLEIRK